MDPRRTNLIIPQKLVLLQKEDKQLQIEQNKKLDWNNRLAFWAVIFGGLAFLSQVAQIVVDVILIKF